MRRKDREVRDRENLAPIFDEADACRLAFAVGGTPYIVTMNFGYEWEGALPVLYFHCAREGRKLEMMRANPKVCFEVDSEHTLVTGPDPCDWGMKYASIVGYGTLSEVLDDSGRSSGLDSVMRHYGWGGGPGGYREGSLSAAAILRLDVEEVSGKRKT
jgi:hypothetical protein